MKISIIIPVFNVKDYLPKCVDSMIHQTYKEIEIILIDDGSDDESGLMCDAYEILDNRIKAFHQKNSGVSAARNAGIEAASGDYLCFFDSDDYLETDMLERMTALTDGADVVICNFYQDYIGRTELFYHGNRTRDFTSTQAVREMIGGNDEPVFLGHVWNKLFRKELLRGIRFNSRYALYEDALFVIRAMIKASVIRYTPYGGYHYVQRGSSAMNGRFSVKTFSSIQAAQEIYMVIKENMPALILEAQLLYLTANIKQAALCVYSQASEDYLKCIRDNLRKEKLKPGIFRRLPVKDRIYLCLLRNNAVLFALFYKIFIKSARSRFESNLRKELFPA